MTYQKLILNFVCFSFALITAFYSHANHYRHITGKFEYNNYFNEPYEMDSLTREEFTEKMRLINMITLENYIRVISTKSLSSISESEDIAESDSIIAALPERARVLFYFFYRVNEEGLLFNPCLSKTNKRTNSVKVIYMSQDQLQELLRLNNTSLVIAVKSVLQIKYLNISVYSFKKVRTVD